MGAYRTVLLPILRSFNVGREEAKAHEQRTATNAVDNDENVVMLPQFPKRKSEMRKAKNDNSQQRPVE